MLGSSWLLIAYNRDTEPPISKIRVITVPVIKTNGLIRPHRKQGKNTQARNSPADVPPLARLTHPILDFACFTDGGRTGTDETFLSCTHRICALTVSRAIVRGIGASKEGAEARRERFHGLKRRHDLGRLIGEQRTPSLGTRRIRHQRKVNQLVSQRNLDGSAQGVRGELVLLAEPAIRRCEFWDARQIERRKTIGRRYRVEVVYERRHFGQERFVGRRRGGEDVERTRDPLGRDGRLTENIRVYV